VQAAETLKGTFWLGVDLFFVLSGFLITGILVDTVERPDYFKNFYGRRTLRIFPLYYGTLCLYLLICLVLSLRPLTQIGLLFLFIQNTPLWLSVPHSALTSATFGHFWSLAVEEQFYLVWPLVIFLLRRRKRILVACVVMGLLSAGCRIALSNAGASSETLYHLSVCRADSLLAGGWLALMIRGPHRDRVLKLAPLFFWFGLLVCIAIGLSGGNFDYIQNSAVERYGFSFAAVMFVGLLAMALRPAGITSRVLRVGWLRFLGKYSFGIYVFHQMVALLINLSGVTAMLAHIPSKAAYHLSFLALTTAITIPLAMLSFHFYEMPFLKLKRMFDYGRPSEVESGSSG
jgi:peptidoglycan/LPS O-acetylase OafA/YrhL